MSGAHRLTHGDYIRAGIAIHKTPEVITHTTKTGLYFIVNHQSANGMNFVINFFRITRWWNQNTVGIKRAIDHTGRYALAVLLKLRYFRI